MNDPGTTSPANAAGGNQPGLGTPSRSPWDVAVITVILAALIALTIYVVHHYATSSTDAATILGIVVPAFATIGAAVFGVTVAYQAGSAKGQSQGASTARRQAAAQLLDPVSQALEAVATAHSSLFTAGNTPSGSEQPLDHAKRQLEFARGVISGFAD